MEALICDICGGNLVMDKSGNFAICDSCGMKHTKERVRTKIQEVKGVVEVVKGETEKERLFKNAETYLQLKEENEAREIYTQITKEYPEEWRGWFGLAKICFNHLSMKYFEENNEMIEEYKRKCLILKPESQKNFDELWDVYKTKYTANVNEEITKYKSKIENGELCFKELGLGGYDKIDRFKIVDLNQPNKLMPFSVSNDTKEVIYNILAQNAKIIVDKLKNSDKICKIENFLRVAKVPNDYSPDCHINMDYHIEGSKTEQDLNIKYTLVDDLNGRDNLEYINKLDEITDLKYLSTKEAIVVGNFGKRFKNIEIYIQFIKEYSMDELLKELLGPSAEEQGELWKKEDLCEKCGSKTNEYGICDKCKYISSNKFQNLDKEIVLLCKQIPDKVNLLQEIYDKFVDDKSDYILQPRQSVYGFSEKFNKKGTYYFDHYTKGIEKVTYTPNYIELMYNVYWDYDNSYLHSLHFNIKIEKVMELVDYLKTRKIANKCQICGGEFRGLLKKICINCGGPKDF